MEVGILQARKLSPERSGYFPKVTQLRRGGSGTSSSSLMREALLALPQMVDCTEPATTQTFARAQGTLMEVLRRKERSGPAYTCSGRNCPAGSLGFGRIGRVGNGQGDGGGKAVTLKTPFHPCSLPSRKSGSWSTVGAKGWGAENECAPRGPGGNAPSSPT